MDTGKHHGNGDDLELRAVAFDEPRRVEVEVDGRAAGAIELTTDWTPHRLELPGEGKRTVTLRTADCRTPASLGGSDDTRCLSFKLQGVALGRVELYRSDADRLQARDLSATERGRLRELSARLDRVRHVPGAAATRPPAGPGDDPGTRRVGEGPRARPAPRTPGRMSDEPVPLEPFLRTLAPLLRGLERRLRQADRD